MEQTAIDRVLGTYFQQFILRKTRFLFYINIGGVGYSAQYNRVPTFVLIVLFEKTKGVDTKLIGL